MSQGTNFGLVFVDGYKPGVGFRPVSRIQQPTVNQILGYVDPANPDGEDGAVVDPTDWNGYVVNYQGCGPGNYNLVFLREGVLQQGQTYSFTTNAVYFSNRLQLLEARIQQGTGEAAQETTRETTEETAGGPGEETTTPDGTPTPDEATATETTETTTTTTETAAPPDDTTTPANETTTTTEEPTTEQVIVNATETENGG